MTSGVSKCEIKRHKGEIWIDGEVTILRPKTFELLLLLASKPGEVFSKLEILDTVWQGTVVEDQVVFQSINEARKELGNTEFIKTYPRRGYSWAIANTTIVDSDTPRESRSRLRDHKVFRVILTTVVIAMIIVAGLYFSPSRQQIEAAQTKSDQRAEVQAHKGILVLPFDVEALDASRKWLRFGAMEGLIKRIAPNQNVTVFHLEDAIEILNRLPAREQDKVDMVFEKSGASYVLQTSLSGVPGEFNVVYTIYSRHDRATKAFSAMNLEAVLSQLVHEFELALNEKLSFGRDGFTRQLQNELMAKAMQFLENNDNESALAFIESAVINEPNNILALYFLSKISLSLGNIESSLAAANKALTLNQSDSFSEYQHRLLYFKGSALLGTGQLADAEISFMQAERKARQHKDWLYYSYSQSMLGKIRQHQEQFDKAQTRFGSALEYQELLHCPLGVTQGHLDFAELYIIMGDRDKAQSHFNAAEKLVTESDLEQARPLILQMQSMLETQNE